MHDRAGVHRGLPPAAGAFPSPCLGLQLPGFIPAANGADKAMWPARREKVSNARRLIREAALELDQGARKIGHLWPREPIRSLYAYTSRGRRATTNRVPGRRGISL